MYKQENNYQTKFETKYQYEINMKSKKYFDFKAKFYDIFNAIVNNLDFIDEFIIIPISPDRTFWFNNKNLLYDSISEFNKLKNMDYLHILSFNYN
jgi:hypothetical protein